MYVRQKKKKKKNEGWPKYVYLQREMHTDTVTDEKKWAGDVQNQQHRLRCLQFSHGNWMLKDILS